MKRHIIVVEDEPDLADLIALHLRRENLKVSVFGDGDSGWEAIQRQVPELVVLDLMLPGLDGYEICRRMRRDNRLAGVQVLMVTARGEESDIVTGLELGAPGAGRAVEHAVAACATRQAVAVLREIPLLQDIPVADDERRAAVGAVGGIPLCIVHVAGVGVPHPVFDGDPACARQCGRWGGRLVQHFPIGVKRAEVQGYVPPEVFHHPRRQLVKLFIGIVFSWDHQSRDLEPHVGFVLEIDQRVQHRL